MSIIHESSEGMKEVRRTQGSSIITDLSKSAADTRFRRRLIKLTIETWHKRYPHEARYFRDALAKLAQVENKNGEYKNKQGYVTMRLPQVLWINLRRVFERCAPDLEAFGTDSSDLEILHAEFPKLVPHYRGKARTD